MYVHEFPKKECNCPTCEIVDLYYYDILHSETPEKLEELVRIAVNHAYDEGFREAIEIDIANKVNLLQQLDEE